MKPQCQIWLLTMPKKTPVSLKKVSVSLPFGIGSASWESDPTERKAAWELYVELVTRIAVQSLQSDLGSTRESLTSLYSLFASTRQILRVAGPQIGISKHSVGGIAIAVLNNGLRPFLSKWHPALQDWESKKESEVSVREHEKYWGQEPFLRKDLEDLRCELEKYANALADIAGVEH